MATVWGVSPKESVNAEAARVGTESLARECMAILDGRRADGRLLYVLAGPASRPVVSGQAGGLGGYWPRVWALRGLRYAWDVAAEGLVVEATTDESWRVREMAAKVIGVHLIDDGLEALGRVTEDPVPRVRTAASAARVALTHAAARGQRRARTTPEGSRGPT